MTSLVDRRQVEKLLVIGAALRAGLIDALAQSGGSAEEVARRAGTDPRATGIILDALVSVEVAEQESSAGPSYRLTESGRRHLVEPGPEYERNGLLHQMTKATGWMQLPFILAHGHPPDRPEPRDIPSFSRAMAEGAAAVMDEVVDACLAYAGGAERVRRMVDVGGAVGHMTRRFADRGVHAALCDRPRVLVEARKHLGAGADELDLLACDFNESLPEGPFDLAYLGNIYHIYSPQQNAALTRRVYANLSAGGTIAIRDYVFERSPRAAMFAVNMLQATEAGGVWREEQYRGWLADAGFQDVEVLDLTLSQNQLLLGRRP